MSFLCLEIGQDLYQHLHAKLHILNRDKLEATVEVFAAGTEVGAGQALIAQAGAVRAATDGNFVGIHAYGSHGFLGTFNHIHDGLNALFHVEIAVHQSQLQSAFTVLLVDVFCSGNHDSLLLLKPYHVMVADDVAQGGLLYNTFHGGQVNEPFITGGMLRLLCGRQQTLELHGDVLGVHHLVLGGTGMDVQTVNNNLCACAIKVLILDLADRAAVGGLGVIGAEALNIDLIGATADFLVVGEADLKSCMSAAVFL